MKLENIREIVRQQLAYCKRDQNLSTKVLEECQDQIYTTLNYTKTVSSAIEDLSTLYREYSTTPQKSLIAPYIKATLTQINNYVLTVEEQTKLNEALNENQPKQKEKASKHKEEPEREFLQAVTQRYIDIHVSIKYPKLKNQSLANARKSLLFQEASKMAREQRSNLKETNDYVSAPRSK